MKSIVTLNDIERMKDALRASLPDVKSSHRVEALARGLGWATNASMRAALAAAPAETSLDEGTFLDYLRLHSFDARGGTLLRAFAQAGLRRAMDLAPELSGFGYRVTRDRGEMPEEAEARFLKNRAEMLGEHGVDEFIRAAEFLSKFGRRKSVNRKRSSYGLKHDAEREAGDYVANGMLIAAAARPDRPRSRRGRTAIIMIGIIIVSMMMPMPARRRRCRRRSSPRRSSARRTCRRAVR